MKFGSPTPDEDAFTAIGQAVADELRRAGLTVLWDGSLHQAVGVVGLNGRRRR